MAEQAGIYAGSGGYDIAVAGKTSLTGAVIASEADPANNRLSTGTLELGEIDNRERWSASQTQLDLGLGAHIGKTAASSGTRDLGTSLAGVNLPGLGRVSATPPVALGASGRQSGTTVSAIAPGTIEITSPDAASLAAAASVSRDPAHANAGALIREFDDTERQEIAAGFDAARTLAKETGTVFANRAKAETVLRDEAAAAQARGDTAEYERLTSEADKLNQTYGGGSAARLLATAITGAAGGDITGSLGGLAQGAAVNVLQGLAASEIKTIADSLDGTAESHGNDV
ncbi:hypothetical protein KK137_10390 [Croceibacterium sp. LX-88]|uniref:Uncharacterized protein n=1 Tax=Croceibacterium selenioxidans TaxID=2838833 RepID=A0ABS5W615_9SPHN|nr:hypothetical protein [Croceibacterium selenioxidans]MBT2134743.1 hypothetical protein [Croceibacterium selenioxidans]